ncbi:MAG: hypothetical protein KTR27_17445 [Leptolyngbyaceae cyanobacterium MAG.088]|nr:hypothetical protein [Leptolyngbyaceae cyanobacterium MAG.088]
MLMPGVAGVCIFGHYALQDWAGLQLAYQEYKRVIDSSTDMSTLFVAQSQQNIQRINLFADGTWTLLSAIFAAIGLHGICVMRS